MIDYQIQLIQFPTKKVKESVVENEDGSYTIFIESSLSREQQKEAFEHAMIHILENDFFKECTADKVEGAAHNTKRHHF